MFIKLRRRDRQARSSDVHFPGCKVGVAICDWGFGLGRDW